MVALQGRLGTVAVGRQLFPSTESGSALGSLSTKYAQTSACLVWCVHRRRQLYVALLSRYDARRDFSRCNDIVKVRSDAIRRH